MIPLIDLSATRAAFTTPDEVSALETKLEAAHWWVRNNPRACVNRIQSVMAVRRKHRVVEVELRPVLKVVR